MNEEIFVHCPKCNKKIDYYKTPTRPFCSSRCKTLDLGDWASEKYSVISEDSPDFKNLEENKQSEEE